MNSKFKDIQTLRFVTTEESLRRELILHCVFVNSNGGESKEASDTEWEPFLTGPLTGPLACYLVLLQD